MRYQRGLLPGATERIGILLVNLGTPNAPTTTAVRRYLAEFLHDHRVIELSRWLWCPLLHGVILRLRPQRSAAAYQKIWREDGSPLMALSRCIAEELDELLRHRHGNAVKVALAMRYGQPSIHAALNELVAAGVERIVVLPLYPQFSCSTTASVYDAVTRTLGKWRNLPALHLVRDYHLDEGYLDALTASVREHWSSHPRAEKLVISFHGTPQRYADQGDPYRSQCEATATALSHRLKLNPDQWVLSFQSRFGRTPWLTPYTDQTLTQLAKAGMPSVDIICPGFAADCLETLEEIALTNAEIFRQAGGQDFSYIACLNDRVDHIKALAAITERAAGNWLTHHLN